MKKQDSIEPLALRPRDAARVLGVSVRTLQDWTRRGIVPCIRQGRVVLYPVSQLQEWLARRMQSADPQGKTTESEPDGS